MNSKWWDGFQTGILVALVALVIVFLNIEPAHGAEQRPPVNFAMLRDVVCQHETRGKVDPDDAVGEAREVGRCQIQKGTAELVGYDVKNRDLMAEGGALSREVAKAVLEYCARKFGPSAGIPTRDTHRITYCYNRGPWSEYEQRGKGWRAWNYANVTSTQYQYRYSSGVMELAER